MRVIVTGRLKQRNYETKEGEKRTVYEVEVDDVGPSLRNASAKVNRVARPQVAARGGFSGGGNRGASSGSNGGYGGQSLVVRRRRQDRGPVGVRRWLLRRTAVLSK